METEALSLNLVMLQGPREGETLQFRPGISVRIGRVARGNTLPIKDAGISSKHLSIGFESGQWVLRDLDSSNGTILNGSKIPPQVPFHLCHGDTIKIGELTSIEVKLQLRHDDEERQNDSEGNQNDDEDTTRPRLNPRRRGTGKAGGSAEVGLVALVEPAKKQARGRPRKVKVLQGEVVEDLLGKVQIQSIDENAVAESGNAVPLQEKVEQQPTINTTTTATRVTRNSKKKQGVIAISESSVQHGPQNSSLECGMENVVAKKTRVGTRRKKLQEEVPKSLCASVDAELEETEVKDGNFLGDKPQETCNGREGEDCSAAQAENLNGDEGWPELERLTLAEWFDFLEVHLPKQITDATEEMIDSMRQKAERLQEYIMNQKNEKGKMPIR